MEKELNKGYFERLMWVILRESFEDGK